MFYNRNFDSDDLHDAKNTLAEYTRRLHELELELRRLENERDELSAAYKEAEAVRIPFFNFSIFYRVFIVITYSILIREGKQKKAELSDCLLNSLNSDTKPKNVLPKKTKRSNLFGKS